MTKTTLTWSQAITSHQENLVIRRRDFHRHPELSFQEHRTAEIVAECLCGAGLEVRTGIAGTGVVGILHGDKPGRTIAWRADIDALPLREPLNSPFASGTPDVMHACGHDGHTAIAMTLAETLAARRTDIPGTIVFIFQPAEELGSGAQPMIEAGVLDHPRVEEVYGLHLTPLIPVGHIAVRPGPCMASADAFDIEITGKGGHGASPHQAIDPITVAANILLGMQNLVSREVPAQEPAVLTAGQIVAGTKHNIIPATAVIRGTLRTFNPSVRTQIIKRLDAFVQHMAWAYDAEAQLSFPRDSTPAVINHPTTAALVRRCATGELGHESVGEGILRMSSDDMSRFLQERPGCYFYVGIAPESGPPRMVHSPDFEMNEDGLPVGLRVALRTMLSALEPVDELS